MGRARDQAFLPRVGPPSGPREHRLGAERAIVVVGAPLGAARAAAMFLVGLPEGLPLPIVLVLGGSAEEHRELGINLQAHCALPVRAIDDKDPLVAGRVHLAPADYHLFVEEHHLSLSTAAPVRGARPCLDVVFESVAEVYGEGAVCILLNGENGEAGASARQESDADGQRGAEKIRARGGLVIVQNPATAVVGTGAAMTPGAAASAVAAATVLHLSEIAPFVSRLGDLELS